MMFARRGVGRDASILRLRSGQACEMTKPHSHNVQDSPQGDHPTHQFGCQDNVPVVR